MKDVDRNLFKYFGFTFLWSWIIWSLLILAGLGVIPIPDKFLKIVTLPVTIMGVFGPLVGALLTLHGESGKGSSLKYLKTFLDMRIGWKTFVFPTLILGGCTGLAWIIPEYFGEPRLPMLLPSIWLFAPYLLFMILMGGGQEEFGWRGYALPRLEQRMGLWRANIFLGIIWACWHIPLWFIPGTGQTFMNFGGFILLMTGYSFLLSWVREMSGNKPFSGLFVHGVANAFIPFMPPLIMKTNVPQPRFWIWVILTFIVGVVIMAFRSNKNSKHEKVFP
jgi:membrane protease YdiL (CAAX protease family)